MGRRSSTTRAWGVNGATDTPLTRGQLEKLAGEEVTTLDPALLRAYGKALQHDFATNQWRLGEVLVVVHTRRLAVDWGFKNFLNYVETELGMPRSYAKRVVGVIKYFSPYRDEVAAIPWWTLVEATKLARQLTPEEAIAFAKEGQGAVRGKLRELHEAGVAIPLEDQTWKRIIFDAPPDVWDLTYKGDGAFDMARRYLAFIGSEWTEKQVWKFVQALFIMGMQGMRDELPPHLLEGPAPTGSPERPRTDELQLTMTQ